MINIEDAPELTYEWFPISLNGSGINYMFVDIENASNFIAQPDGDEIERIFLDALKDRTEGVIVYQATGNLPQDCSYLALIKDIKNLEELRGMLQDRNSEDTSLLLNMQRFLWSGIFTSEETQISVGKSTEPPGSECVEAIETESESEDDRSLASEDTAAEAPVQIQGITTRTHRILTLKDRTRLFTFVFFGLRDALNMQFKFPDEGDQDSLARLLKEFEGKPWRNQIIIHLPRAYIPRSSLPPQGVPRFGLAYSNTLQPIKQLSDLIQHTEASVAAKEPFLRLHFRCGNRSIALDCDNKTLTKPTFVNLTGSGNSYDFFDFKHIGTYMNGKEETFLKACEEKNITQEGLIARQENDAPDGCTRFSLVKDCRGQLIKNTEELIKLMMGDYIKEPVLHLQFERFQLSGTFTSAMPISVDKRSFL